jgi:hypothetical protein
MDMPSIAPPNTHANTIELIAMELMFVTPLDPTQVIRVVAATGVLKD